MASFLALDWDQKRIHLLAATLSRGGVHIDQALLWEETAELTPANAEAIGQRLKQRLKDAKISSAPVLACLGRDRVVLKEIQFPRVDAEQEPGLVRFQAMKELTEPAETVALDYVPLDAPGPEGQRRALLLITRRQLLNSYKTMLQSAGLKLQALTPRSLGIAAGLGSAGVPKNLVVAVLTLAQGWAEFAVVRGSTVLFSRPIPLGDALAGEVRRNMTLFVGQPHVHPTRDAIQALYVLANPEMESSLQRLDEVVPVPVHRVDPFAVLEGAKISGDPAGFAGALGLLHCMAESQNVPANFAAPREPKPVEGPNSRKRLLAGGVGFLVLLVLWFAGMQQVNSREETLQERRTELDQADQRLKRLQPEGKQIAALADWQKSAVPVIDEIYDLSARFPFRQNLRVQQLNFTPYSHPKEPYTARLVLTGVVPRDEVQLVHQLVDTINRDKHCRAAIESLRVTGSTSSEGAKNLQEFTLRVDIAPRPASAYQLKLPPAEPQERKGRSGRGGSL